jgi:hypothetical protein
MDAPALVEIYRPFVEASGRAYQWSVEISA